MVDALIMLNNRQKCLYYYIQKSESCSKIKLAKVFFCMNYESKINEKFKFYGFLPYKFGPYSFELFHDAETMKSEGYFTEENNDIIFQAGNVNISPYVKKFVNQYLLRFSSMNEKELINYVYGKYPEYTIFSEIRRESNYLKDLTGIYTTGYEGLSIDEFLMKMIQEKIDCLIDVRNNPWSMKFGYCKNDLSVFCEKIGIEYSSMPSLGITSDLRKNLEKKDDYEKLFSFYSKYLRNKQEEVKFLKKLSEKKRVALMCFEKDPKYCHRNILAKELEKYGAEVEIN